MDKKNIQEKQDWKKFDAGKIRKAMDSSNFCHACSTLSDRDIIYGESYFSKVVGEFEESELVQDILWSLWEESRYAGNLIHAETIKADLKIDRSNRVPEVKQFSLSFKVSNLIGSKSKVFRTIELEPHTETEVNILLDNSELRPMPVAGGEQGMKYAAWNLFPKNSNWKIIKNYQKPTRQTIKENYDSLQLVYGSSRFIPYTISKDGGMKVAINAIDYPYIKSKLASYLNLITAEQVQKDIESWYGGYFAYLLRNRILDIKEIIDLMQKRTIINDNGIKESIFQRTLADYQFRNNLYYHFKIKGDSKKIVDKLLTNNGQANEKLRIKIEEIIGLLKSWVYQLEQIQKSIRVEIKWNKTPVRVYSEVGQNSEFPAFAFDFEQKITWVKDMKIPLKGRWNTKKNEYEDKHTQEDGEYIFNITDKLTSIKDILAPLTSTFASLNNSLGKINFMEDLLPDVGKFIGIDSLQISAGESISYNYKTAGTPITLAFDETADLRENYFPKKNIGWKALDVSASLNLENFTKFFYSIYEKLDKGTPEKGTLDLTQILQAKKDLTKTPISFITHAINSIFDETYDTNKERQKDSKKRPWTVFFESLFSDPLKFEHSQMMVGYSVLFFEYESWWGKENKLDSNSEDCKGSKTEKTEAWCTNFDFSKKEAIAKPINEEIELISSSLLFNQSIYMPDAPIILSWFDNGEQYERVLKDSKAGKTTTGLLNSTKKIVGALKQDYENSSEAFEGRKSMNWDNAKVSFAQLNLKKAIDSVLALKNNVSGWSSSLGWSLTLAGIKLHEILGEALVRDGFWINVNLMHEYGIFTKNDLKVTKRMNYFPNSEIWLKASPDLDRKKLKLGGLSALIS